MKRKRLKPSRIARTLLRRPHEVVPCRRSLRRPRVARSRSGTARGRAGLVREPGVIAVCRMRRSRPQPRSPRAHSRRRPRPGRGVAPALARAMAALPAFCRVAVTSKPTADSDIKIEVWLPASGWNGKFQAVGNGGWAGTISYPAMAAAIARGYATASTDSGHTTPGASFAVGHPEKLVDYAHRSLHEMAVNAKVGRQRVLRQTATAVSVERMFNGRKPGADARVDVPERLRRHRRGRAAGYPIARARRAPRAASVRPPHARQLHSAREVSGCSHRRDGGVRCEGWRERRHPRESRVRAASIRRCFSARMRTVRHA